jgi:hypothetical protein
MNHFFFPLLDTQLHLLSFDFIDITDIFVTAWNFIECKAIEPPAIVDLSQ